MRTCSCLLCLCQKASSWAQPPCPSPPYTESRREVESRGGTESREHRGGADWGVTLPPGREEKYCWMEVTRAGGSTGSGRRAGWKGGMEIVIVEIVIVMVEMVVLILEMVIMMVEMLVVILQVLSILV